MAWYDANVANISWLNPKESPADIWTKGLSAGSMVAQSMGRQQELAMEQQKLPLQMQQLDLKNRMDAATIQSEGLHNQVLAQDVNDRAWDAPIISKWAQGDEGSILDTTPQGLRSTKSLDFVALMKKTTAQNSAARAQDEMDTKNLVAVDWLRTHGGVDVPERKRPNGETYFDGSDIAAAGLQLEERKQAQLLEVWQQRGANTLGAIDERANNASGLEAQKQQGRMELADFKNANDINKYLVNGPTGMSGELRMGLKAMSADLQSIEIREKAYLSTTRSPEEMDTQNRLFAAERVRVQRKYSYLSKPLSASSPTATPGAASVPDQTNPKSGLHAPPVGTSRPTTAAEYDALPSGTLYINPATGTLKRKP